MCKTNKTIKLPERISPSFLKLIDEANPSDAQALRREVYFSKNELLSEAYESSDPLGEAYYRINENCIHQYPNRVLLLTSGRCLSYCRYCFRRDFTSRQRDVIKENDLDTVLDYIEKNPTINEILLSGGDPLSASFSQLKNILEHIRKRNKDILLRICTRANIFAPELFNPKLISLFQVSKPLWIIPHINHPAELGDAQSTSIKNCINAGIPMLSQTVLLQGVNADAEILAKLFRKLIVLGVKPGYLFQLDTASGTSHFAVPFNEAIKIWEKLMPLVSGLSRPDFAVDLQNGGGKFPISAVALHDKIIHISEKGFSVKKADGKIYTYKE